MRKRDVEIKKKKVDHVSMDKTVRQVAEDAGQQQSERDISPRIDRTAPESNIAKTTISAEHESAIKIRCCS